MDKTMNCIPDLPCMGASYRRASRVLTQLYDEALRPLGVRATQFTVLQALRLAGEVSQSQLGAILALDSTTLTRTLEIMRRRGWIAERRGRDRRERLVRLVKAGENQFTRAQPAWRKTQGRLRRRLGGGRWRKLFDTTREITLLAKGGMS